MSEKLTEVLYMRFSKLIKAIEKYNTDMTEMSK